MSKSEAEEVGGCEAAGDGATFSKRGEEGRSEAYFQTDRRDGRLHRAVLVAESVQIAAATARRVGERIAGVVRYKGLDFPVALEREGNERSSR